MGYELKREDIFGLANAIGADVHEKDNELFFRTCPKCGGGYGHADKDTFSINLSTGAFKCFRATCNYHGHFVELARDFNYNLEYERPKIYKKLHQPLEIKSTEWAVKYLERRGIYEDVCKKFEVTTRKDNPTVMVFPFYDDKGILQFVKYRNLAYVKGKTQGCKEWCEKDTMPILFGMKQANDFTRPLVITEGQIDSLSLAQAGIPNAVSVPTGAQGFTWLSNCWEWLNKWKEIVVFGDYENGKITLVDGIKARLEKNITIKCVKKQDYLGEKDANDILTKYGTNALITAVNNAEMPKLENVKELASVKSVNINELEKIKTGIQEIDRVIGGMCMGQVILLTGKRGEGKSTFMSQLICSALDQNESIFAYSGELADFHFKRWIDYQLAGTNYITECKNEYGDMVYSIEDYTIAEINEWYKGRAFIYDNEYVADKDEFEGIIETIEKVIKQYGTRFICIDNLMTAMDVVTEQDNLYLAQSNFVGQLKKLAMKYQVVVLLVAHPRKSKEEFVNDDVSGSSDITNKVDIVMAYSRCEDGNADSLLQITKNRLFGILKLGKDNGIKLMYSQKTKRIFSPYDKKIKMYGWEKPIPTQLTDINLLDDLELTEIDDGYLPF